MKHDTQHNAVMLEYCQSVVMLGVISAMCQFCCVWLTYYYTKLTTTVQRFTVIQKTSVNLLKINNLDGVLFDIVKRPL
jgi:hypothetical protein